MDILQNKWPVLFKIVKFMKDKEMLRDCSILKDTKETWQLNVTYNPGLGPSVIKHISETTGEVEMRSVDYKTVSVLIYWYLIIVPELCKRMTLFLENIHWIMRDVEALCQQFSNKAVKKNVIDTIMCVYVYMYTRR